VWFTLPLLLPTKRWALTPPFHPYPANAGRYIFCGTFSDYGISSAIPGRYPAPCSMKFGLSSSILNKEAIARTELFYFSLKLF